MSRRSAFNQRDVTKAFKAATAAGVQASVVIRPDGTIVIAPVDPMHLTNDADEDFAQRLESWGAR